jgi:hypothetical protein
MAEPEPELEAAGKQPRRARASIKKDSPLMQGILQIQKERVTKQPPPPAAGTQALAMPCLQR